ncbi:MAG: ribosome silencing factor [Gammaproteobacteria bacterium]|nr:ribosome silencing factor [Gammaproteobacteria bacterium]
MARNLRLETLLKSLEDNQAIDIEVINVREQTSVTDFMIVCTGRASRHLRALAEHLMTDMKQAGWPALSKHGLDDGEWALVDFGEFVVHIMQASSHDFYNLEALWQDLPKEANA